MDQWKLCDGYNGMQDKNIMDLRTQMGGYSWVVGTQTVGQEEL